jgi:hypothetical protein
LNDAVTRVLTGAGAAFALANVHENAHVHESVNTASIMNTPTSSFALERALAGRLRELLGGVEWLRGVEVTAFQESGDRGFDLLAKLPLPGGGTAALCVECKREMRPSAFAMLAEREFDPGGKPKVIVPVLALPWVSPRLAELCSERGWSWYDLAGNCCLNVPGLLHLRHTGNAPVHERGKPLANLGTKEASRVMAALLHPTNAGCRWTQRALMQHCQPNVSLGLVNKVINHLRDEALVAAGADGGIRVTEPVRLLSAWRTSYRFKQHERHGYFTLLKGPALREALAGFGLATGGRAAYAAFSAADLQQPNVRQFRTWLYVAAAEMERFEQMVEAKPVDSGENLVVLVPADEGVFYLAEGGTVGQSRLACTNLVQTFVDLCHCGGRGQEAAEALLNHQLIPKWKAAGLKV